MHLTPREIEKLALLTLGAIAEKRLKKGLKLNYPEAVAYITSSALEGAREGKDVEQVMKDAASVRFPLNGSGVRYGASVSINSLSSGTNFATSINERAFLNVTGPAIDT